MTTRFHVDLLHPGGVAETWQEWFTGPRGGRRLALLALCAVVLLLAVLAVGVVPAQRRLTSDLNAMPALRRDLASRGSDLGLLRSNLQGLSKEARRQVRWSDLLAMFSRDTPPDLRLQIVEMARVASPPPPGQPAGTPGKSEETLRIEALTPLRPGSAPLSDVGRFMAALMRDPEVAKRFELKSWDVKPSPTVTPAGEQLLSVNIVLVERPQ